MGFLSRIFGVGEAADAVTAVGGVFDELFTSDEERAQAAAVMERLRQEPGKLQAAINQVEAGHRSVFVAGWRPGIGWVCAISLFAFYVPQFVMASYLWVDLVVSTGEMQPYPATDDGLMELVLALLGMGTLRTVEKLQGRAK